MAQVVLQRRRRGNCVEVADGLPGWSPSVTARPRAPGARLHGPGVVVVRHRSQGGELPTG
ncbi:hypothetical protein NKH77_22070 [Streptomyces sp. M19]